MSIVSTIYIFCILHETYQKCNFSKYQENSFSEYKKAQPLSETRNSCAYNDSDRIVVVKAGGAERKIADHHSEIFKTKVTKGIRADRFADLLRRVL